MTQAANLNWERNDHSTVWDGLIEMCKNAKSDRVTLVPEDFVREFTSWPLEKSEDLPDLLVEMQMTVVRLEKDDAFLQGPLLTGVILRDDTVLDVHVNRNIADFLLADRDLYRKAFSGFER